MKKVLCVIVVCMMLLLCSCAGDTVDDTSAPSPVTTTTTTSVTTTTTTTTEGSATATRAADEMTLIRLSPNGGPVCKVTSDREALERVRQLIADVEKEPFDGVMPGGWRFKVDFSDGAIFTVGFDLLGSNTGNSIITAADADALYEALVTIYDATDAAEERYTAYRYY